MLHDQTCTKAKTVLSSHKIDDFNYELTPKLLFFYVVGQIKVT